MIMMIGYSRYIYHCLVIVVTVNLFVRSTYSLPAEGRENRYKALYERAEKFNFGEIVESHRLFKNYINCFVEKGPCTESAKNGRVLLRDLMDTRCKDVCSDKLTKNFRIALKAFKERHPDEWQLYLRKADPKGTKREKLFEFINGEPEIDENITTVPTQ